MGIKEQPEHSLERPSESIRAIPKNAIERLCDGLVARGIDLYFSPVNTDAESFFTTSFTWDELPKEVQNTICETLSDALNGQD